MHVLVVNVVGSGSGSEKSGSGASLTSADSVNWTQCEPTDNDDGRHDTTLVRLVIHVSDTSGERLTGLLVCGCMSR